jgi:phosphoglycolate phosphatase-like HAD superfamily hydrolase
MPKAVIFDVDGVLLNLTPPEVDGFFEPFREIYGLTGLSRDWNSYRTRNDVLIVEEIIGTHFKRPLKPDEFSAWRQRYLEIIRDWLARRVFAVEVIPGALDLLRDLSASGVITGIATANIIDAARIRLESAGLWPHIHYASGAEDGGPKQEILAHLVSRLGLRQGDVIYIGDNLNDVAAGHSVAGHFIGFSTEREQRRILRNHGAELVVSNHMGTRRLLKPLLESARLETSLP